MPFNKAFFIGIVFSLSAEVFASDCALPAGFSLMGSPDLSQDTFSKVRQELQIVRKIGSSEPRHYAISLEKTATNLEFMPVTGVDKRITNFSLDTAQRLRNIALAFRDIGLVSSIYNTTYTSCSGYNGYYSYYFGWYCNTYRDYRARRVAERDAELFRMNQAGEIQRKLAELRVCLVEDYTVDFQ
jgi:hypothetical protein